MGITSWEESDPVIYLSHRLSKIQRRCVLAHELQHIERGQPCLDRAMLDEQRVVAATARWLLTDFAAVCDVVSRMDIRQAAASLLVTRRVLTDRLDDLNAAEIAQLGEVLPRLEHAS